MLNRTDEIERHQVFDHHASDDMNSPAKGIDYDKLLAASRRQYRVVIITIGVFIFLGLLYIVTAQPKYTATNSILIDSQKDPTVLNSTIADASFDTGAIDSQVEVIKSDNVATLVVNALQLTKDAEFTRDSGLFSIVASTLRSIFDFRAWYTSQDVLAEEAKEAAMRAAIFKLQDNLDVKRVLRTYVLSISYTSPDPLKAKKIANSFAEAYFTDQLNARYEETKRASGWLQDRLAELKVKSLAADLAVQRFKAKNGLVTTGDGTFVGDQQVAELTTQLSTAHDDTAKAEAKLQQINEIIKAGKPDAAVTDTLGNPVINDLRSKYLKASKTATELAAKLGNDHYQVISLKNDMLQYQRLIFTELQRTAETYSSDVDVARAKEKSLNETMTSLVGQQAASNEIMVQLRELDRESDTYKALYSTFLQRYQDALQQQSFPTTEARTITQASVPDHPSSPKVLLVLALSTILGLLSGCGLGAIRERRDNVFRIAQQARDVLGLNFIGMLQIVPKKDVPVGPEAQDPRQLMIRESLLKHSINAPLSSYAETLRTAKVEIDLELVGQQRAKIIGVVSVLPSEGKTTTAKNFASLVATLGPRTILIDGDLRNPGLTRHIARHATAGLLEVLRGERSIANTIMTEPESGLDFLPAVVKKRVFQSSELLSSQEMETMLRDLSAHYDYIVVDLPPIGPVIDVKAAARLFDGFLFVVEWGKTPRSLVQVALADDQILYDKCVGVIYNRVSTEKLKFYNTEASKSYYYGRYGNYYIDKPDKRKAEMKRI